MLKTKKYNFLLAWCCFAVILVFYILTSCRTVPPYRDSGELITAACTLSVAHSPGYPTYMVMGKFFITLGKLFGINPAWSMNLFSGVAGAFAVFFLVLLIFELTRNIWVGIFGGLLCGFAYMNWYLSVVSEMYSLNLMFVVLLLYLLIKRKFLLFSFITGLMFGNHLTSLLAVLPMVVFILLTEKFRFNANILNDDGSFDMINLSKSTLVFMLGLSVYMYLPVRAINQPFINWGDPSNFTRLLQVVSRAAYGHTLDLVSREVTLKQVYIPHLDIFIKSLLIGLSTVGVVLALVGAISILKIKEKRQAYFYIMLVSIFTMTGPFFLYMAKMPVNPHAVSIVEVGYMIPLMVLAVFASIGLFMVIKTIRFKYLKYCILVIAVLLPLFNAFKIYSRVDKSANYLAEDYALNILNTVGRDAVVIMRRDHTMFALWYKRYIEGVRNDVKVISKGLLSAGWYRQKLKIDHPDINWKENFESDESYMEWVYKKYSDKIPVYLTAAAAGEMSPSFFEKYDLVSAGLVLRIVKKGTADDTDKIVSMIDNVFKFRGNYETSLYYDFFSRDFIGLYAQLYDRLGLEYYKINRIPDARKMYIKAFETDPYYYRPYSNLAFTFYSQGDYTKAQEIYIAAIERLEKKISEYTRKQFFKKDLAELYNNLGAIYEKSLRNEQKQEYFIKALASYDKATDLIEGYSQAHYNKGVLYWYKKDWTRVVENFETALKYDPENVQIKKYLLAARKNLRQKY